MLRSVALAERRAVQHAVDAGDGILHHHAVLAHVHQLAQCQGDDRRDDDVEQQVQQQRVVHRAVGKPEAAENQEHEHAIDRQRVQTHRPAQILRVGDGPALVVVDGGLEFLEGEHRLPEGLDHGDAADVLHRLARHVRQRVLILSHLLLKALACHARHRRKTQQRGSQAQQAQPPVEARQQRKQTRDGGHGPRLVGQLMRQIGFRRAGGLQNGSAQPAAAELLNRAQRQRGDVFRHAQAQIGGDAERRQVRAHETRDVNQHGEHREQHGHPSVMGDMHGLRVARRSLDDLPENAPDVPEGQQGDQRADGGKDP